MAKNLVTPSGEDSQHIRGEIWKHVPSEPGVLASSLGRVLQAPCYAPLPNGGYRLHTPEPRYGQISKAKKTASHEYRHIMIRRYGDGPRQQPRKVHQLVCEAFHGPKPFQSAVVIHLDEDAHNNRPENLRWGTQKENLNSPKFLEYRRSIRGDLHPGTKYSDATVREIRAMYESGVGPSEIAGIFGMSSGAASDIATGKRR